jgi:aryl-alcohol dehydrogenase-like predicted oxidoreductase
VSLGLWHNFGDDSEHSAKRKLCRTAFDLGITHFDLANNYGPPPGSAEIAFGNILRKDFARHRDEMIISSKAGYYMWPGPYGEWGSRKYLLASLDQSLKRWSGQGYFYSIALIPTRHWKNHGRTTRRGAAAPLRRHFIMMRRQ